MTISSSIPTTIFEQQDQALAQQHVQTIKSVIKTKYAIFTTAAVLSLVAFAPVVCKIIVAGGAILIDHPELSSLGQVICEP